MRCELVKQWISNSRGPLSPAMTDHLLNCSECARVAEAAGILNRLLKAGRGQYDISPLPEVRRSVEARQQKRSRLENIMSKIEDQYETRPRLLAGVGLAAVVVAFITLIPFPSSQIVGYQITLAGMNAGATVSTDVLVSTLAAVGYEGVRTSVAQEADLCVYSLAGLSSEEDARTLATALARVAVVERKVVVRPLVRSVSAPLYAQVVDRVKLGIKVKERPVKLVYEDGRLVLDGRDFQSIVSSPRYTDAQVEAQIDSILAEFGIGADEVKVEAKTSTDGYTRRLCLRMVNDTLLETDAPAIEVTVREGDIHLRTDGAGATIVDTDADGENLLFRCCNKDFKGKSIIVVVELEVDED